MNIHSHYDPSPAWSPDCTEVVGDVKGQMHYANLKGGVVSSILGRSAGGKGRPLSWMLLRCSADLMLVVIISPWLRNEKKIATSRPSF